MEFWGVEVKSGKSYSVEVEDQRVIHLSQACLGESRDKGNDPIYLYVTINNKKLVMGTLFPNKCPQLQFDLMFQKRFTLSHSWKSGTVNFLGYESDLADYRSGSETPKRVEKVSKKRPAESASRTAGKKAKFATPKKTEAADNKKSNVHVDTPYPSKQAGKASANQSNQKTPESAKAHSCQPCERSFKSDKALESHSKAKHSNAREMMERLPNDLWIKIFLRLPVKTILQCLSVCKSWQLFIQHPSFIDAHLQHQSRDLMFVRYTQEDNSKKKTTLAKKEINLYSFHCDDENFTVYATYKFPVCDYLPNCRVVGSCNGVICVTNDLFSIGYETYLWNPTIQKCIELPRPVFTYKEIGPFEQELGFGFDKKNNDYKVVRIVKPDYSDLKVEIYSLSSGLWREGSHLPSDLGVEIIEKIATGKDCQVYLNGFLHWIGMDRKQSHSVIIAFNLTDEMFHCFEPPINLNRWNCRGSRLVVFQEFLSFYHYAGRKCSIWTMKNYGDSTSWAKYVDVNLSNDVSRVIGLTRKGKLLISRVIGLTRKGKLLIEIQRGLYSYEPEAAKGKELIFLNEDDLRIWKLLQEGEIVFEIDGHHYPYLVHQRIRDYDPESAPKELGLRSNTDGDLYSSFHSESYRESLVLVERKNCRPVKCKTKESKMIH